MNFKKKWLSMAVSAAVLCVPATGILQPLHASEPLQLAQVTESGSVQGRVTGAQDLPLQGAVVRITGTQLETSTGRDGSFLFPTVPAGNQEVEIRFGGYETERLSLDVRSGQRERVTAALSSSLALEGMTIVGYRGAQSRAMMQQRASDRIVNVVSSDTLGDFPDISVGESVARIAGVAVTRHRGEADAAVIRGGNPSWTKVSVDGMDIPSAGGGRSVSLGQISSDVVASIEVTKAPTPDQDADAIGGTINIVTRGALTSPHRFTGKASGGHSELGSRNNYDAALSVAHVFGEIDELGVMFSASKNSVDREMNNVENDHTMADGEWLPSRIQTKAYDILRERESAELRFDYMNAEGDTHYYVNLTRSNYLADEDRHNVIIRNNGAYLDGSDAINGGWSRTRVEANWRDRHDENTQNMVTAGGRHEFDGVELDYTAAISRAKHIRKPGRKSWTYRGNFNDAALYDYSNPDFPVIRWADSGEIPNIGSNVAESDLAFRHGNNYLERRRQDEDGMQAQVNLKMPKEMAGNLGYWKFGAKFTERDRSHDYSRELITAGGPELSQISSNREINNFGQFPFGSRFDKRVADSFVPEMELRTSLSHAYSNDFEINEKVYATYGMSVVDLGYWRLIGGVRVEHTDNSSLGYRSLDNWASIPEPSSDSRSYTNIFPGLHAKFDWTENLVLRAAYTTGIERPSFSDLRPTVAVNDDTFSISSSNMDLDPARSQSADLMLEYYIAPIGLISGGVFVKHIEDIHFGFSRAAQPGEVFNGFAVPDTGWMVSTRVNAERSAQIRGVELSWDQALIFLPAPFDGFGVFANYTYTNSEGYLPGTNERVPLGAQPDDTVNLAVYYERSGFSTRLAYNYQSKRISNYGQGTPDTYNWWDDRSIVDLTARYSFTDNLTVYLEASNLTDTYARRYLGDRQRVYELEDFGRSYSLGLRFNF